MRVVFFLCIGWLLVGCDSSRVFEENKDFETRSWDAEEKPIFVFSITDTTQAFNIYINIRNTVDFPNANIYYRYSVLDSLNRELENRLVSNFLFDEKTGKPFGSSALGDIFDHQFLILDQYEFKNVGEHKIKLEQFMRMDTLPGILSVGTRVEYATSKN